MTLAPVAQLPMNTQPVRDYLLGLQNRIVQALQAEADYRQRIAGPWNSVAPSPQTSAGGPMGASDGSHSSGGM